MGQTWEGLAQAPFPGESSTTTRPKRGASLGGGNARLPAPRRSRARSPGTSIVRGFPAATMGSDHGR